MTSVNNETEPQSDAESAKPLRVDSIVRQNLLSVPGYSPGCGVCNRRTVFDVNTGQFICKCGWQSSFEPEFVAAVRSFRIGSQVCKKCGVTVANNKSKYCGDGSDKDNPHRWELPAYK